MLPGLGIFLISFITFFRNIGSYPLRNWDEAWYGEIIKNMASGTYGYMVPFWNGQYYFDKPPLYFWLSLPFFKFSPPPAGGEEWQARIVSATAAAVATLLVYLIGKKLFNPVCGLLSALVFLTLGQVVIRFASGNLDGLLVCLFLSSFYFYLRSNESKLFPALAGISLGLGFLTKGYFLGLFPALLITLYSISTTKKLPKNLILITSSALISSLWWYVLGTIKFGKPFFDWYVLSPGGNLLKLPLSSFSMSYFGDLIRDVGFWWIPIATAAIYVGKNIASKEKKVLVSLVAAVFLFIFPLNFLSEKLRWYNLPAYPLLTIIVGYFASKMIKDYSKITTVLSAIVTIAQIYNVIRIENIFPDRSKVGADLGKHAASLIQQEDTVILDDHDFTSFLYYSDHKKVFMVQKNGGKAGEWWILDYTNLPQFVKTQSKTWIITPDPNNLPRDLKNPKTEATFNGYTFISFTADTI